MASVHPPTRALGGARGINACELMWRWLLGCASIGLCLGWVHDMLEGGERVHAARVAHVELLNFDWASRVATRTELLPRGE